MTPQLFRILSKPARIRQRIKDLESELEAYRQTMELSGIRYDQDKVQSSPKDRMPDYAARVERLLREIKARQQDYLKAHDDVKKMAYKLKPIERSIIIQWYLEGKKPEDIADSFPMSERNMYRYKRSAIEHLENLSVNVSRKS